METATRDALVARFRRFDPAVELAVGRRPDVAGALADHVAVTATDVVDRPVPAGVRFVRDDLTSPDRSVYSGAAGLYALNLPPELHRPALDLAAAVDAALAFTTLGGDPPAVDVERLETLPAETLYWARERVRMRRR